MDQYTNSILQLPEFETTRAITYAEKQIGGHRVIIETLHGRITGAVPDSCPHCGGRLHANQQLLWKPISEPPIALQVGLLYRDSQRQQASLALLRALLED